jgi:hypothetical protein
MWSGSEVQWLFSEGGKEMARWMASQPATHNVYSPNIQKLH